MLTAPWAEHRPWRCCHPGAQKTVAMRHNSRLLEGKGVAQEFTIPVLTEPLGSFETSPWSVGFPGLVFSCCILGI